MLNQNNHEEILREHLEKFGCKVELGTELVALEQDEDGVTAHVRVGSEDKTFRTQYLVGADGARGMFFTDNRMYHVRSRCMQVLSGSCSS